MEHFGGHHFAWFAAFTPFWLRLVSTFSNYCIDESELRQHFLVVSFRFSVDYYTAWLFPQSLSHGDTLFAASLADRKVCPFIIIFSPFFRFCRRTHKTFVRSHTHTRPPPKIGRPPNTRPKKDDDNPFTLFCFFFALQPHTYIVCRVVRRDGTRIHLCTDTGLPKASRPSTRFSRVFTFNLGSAAAASSR